MVKNIGEFVDVVENFNDLKNSEKIKLIAFFYCTINKQEDFTMHEIKSIFKDENLHVPQNFSRDFKQLVRSKGKHSPILEKNGKYTFNRFEYNNLKETYLGNSHSKKIANNLRNLFVKLDSEEQKSFLDEAIISFENKAFRSSIVMSWLLAIDSIYDYILTKKLSDFNHGIQKQGKYKKVVIRNKDDFSEIKETDFIEILRTSKIISNDLRKILDEKLGFRNTCAHPNSIKVKETKVVSDIEDIVENIVLKFKV